MKKSFAFIFIFAMMIFICGIAYGESEIASDAKTIVIDGTTETAVESAPTVPAAAGISLSASTAELYIGDQVSLAAAILPEGAEQGVAWTSSNETAATVSDGMVSGLSAGNAQITAVSKDGGFSAVCDVTVKNILISGLTFNFQELKGVAGEKLDVSYADLSITPENATDRRIKWETANSDLVSIDTESNPDKAVLTLNAAGTAEITVKAEANETIYASFQVIITETAAEVPATETPAEETAAEPPAEGPAAESPAEETAGETPAEETAAEPPAEGRAVESPAEVPAGETPTGEAAAETPAEEPAAETPAEEETVPVSWFAINEEELKIAIGETAAVKVYLYPENAASIPLKWTVSDPSIASINSETNEITGLTDGTVTIRAESMDGKLFAETTVDIKEKNDLTVSDEKTINSEGDKIERTIPIDTNLSNIINLNDAVQQNAVYACTSLSCMESSHPYTNNESDVWFYDSESTDVLKVTFSSDTYAESGYDKFFVYTYKGGQQYYAERGYTGSDLADSTWYLPAGKFGVGLTSDGSQTGYGIRVTSITRISSIINIPTIYDFAKMQFQLSWPEIPQASGYRIWRSSTSADSGYSVIGTTGSVTSTVSSVPAYGTYYFKIAPVFKIADIEIISSESTPVQAVMSLPAAPQLNIPTVYDHSKKQFRLSWSAVSGATGYRIWRSSTSASSGFSVIGTTGNVTNTISSVSAYGTYYYKVAAIVNGQIGPISSPKSGVMIAAAVPAVMNTPTIYNAANKQFRLSWSAVSGATGYRIWRSSTSASSGFSVIGTTGNVTNTISSVSAYGTYYYKVAAIENGQIGPISSPKSGVMIAADVPAVMNTPTIYNAAKKQFRLSWSAVSGATGYRIWRSSTSGSSGFSVIGTTGNVTSTISSVASGGTYYYKVASIVNGQIGNISTAVQGVMTVAAAPTMNVPTINNVENKQFNLTWSAVNGATGYRIWCSSTSLYSGYGEVWTVENTIAATHTVSSAGTFYFKVAAIVNGQIGLISTPVSGIMSDYYPGPSLNTPIKNGSELILSWSTVSGVDEYSIWRSSQFPNSGFSKLKSVSGSVNSVHTDVPLLNKTYYYYIQSMKAGQGYGESNVQGGSIPLDKPTAYTPVVATDSALRLSWSAVEGATGYRIWRTKHVNNEFSEVGTVGLVTSTTNQVDSWTDTYYYRIQSLLGTKGGSYSNIVSGQLKLDAPVLSILMSGNTANLSWNAVPGAAYYTIYYSSRTSNGVWGVSTGTGYGKIIPTENEAYTFLVVAVNGNRCSVDSNTVQGTYVVADPWPLTSPALANANPSNYTSCALYAQARRPSLGRASVGTACSGYNRDSAYNYRCKFPSFQIKDVKKCETDLRQCINVGYAIVWDKESMQNDDGHVAIVEAVYQDSIIVSHSGWSTGTRTTRTRAQLSMVWVIP